MGTGDEKGEGGGEGDGKEKEKGIGRGSKRETYDERREDVQAGGVAEGRAVHEGDDERHGRRAGDRGGLDERLDDAPHLRLRAPPRERVVRLGLAADAQDPREDTYCTNGA